MADEGGGLRAAAAAAAREAGADNAGRAGRGLMPIPVPFGGDQADDAAHEVAGAGADVVAGAGAGGPGERAAPFPVGDIDDADPNVAGGGAVDDDDKVQKDFLTACGEVGHEFAKLCEGVAADACPWCRKPGCCSRQIADSVLIQMRARAMATTRAHRASGIAYLANALAAARPEGAGPRADGGGVDRRGAGRAAALLVRGVRVCRGAFIWVNRFGSTAWDLALKAADEHGVFVPVYGRVGQSSVSEKDKEKRRVCVVFWINLVRHIGMQIPATEFSKTTNVLPAGTTIHGTYINQFVPAVVARLLSEYHFTDEDNSSPERLPFLKESVASIRGELCDNVEHRRQSEGPGRKARRTPGQLAAVLLVPLGVASSEEGKSAVRERIAKIVSDISVDVPSWGVFLDVWHHAPELEHMGIEPMPPVAAGGEGAAAEAPQVRANVAPRYRRVTWSAQQALLHVAGVGGIAQLAAPLPAVRQPAACFWGLAALTAVSGPQDDAMAAGAPAPAPLAAVAAPGGAIAVAPSARKRARPADAGAAASAEGGAAAAGPPQVAAVTRLSRAGR